MVPDLARRPRGRLSVAMLTLSVASALTVGLLTPTASADDLTDQRARVSQQLARTTSELNESSTALSAAGEALQEAQGKLEAARAELSRTQDELVVARKRDAALARQLKKARAALAAAKAAVRAGQQDLDEKQAMAADLVRDQYQQQTNLLPVAVLLQNSSTSDLQTRLQWSTTMFDTTSTTIAELTVLQERLRARKARQARLARQVADDRAAARENLELKQRLELHAESQAASVGQLVARRRSIESAAAADVAQDRSQYARLARERAQVEQRIATRIERAKAAAARQAVRQRAEQRAGAAAARLRATRAQAEAKRAGKRASTVRSKPAGRAAAARPHAPAPRPAPARRNSSGGSGAHHGFGYPVSASITSSYGMRLHPVTHVWKLHDGTDFAAGCGTAIRAAASGRVAERYYSGGYGNRLMIDHGYVDGRYVTTGYNHAIRYSVSVGQQVRQGQVIGYVGSTGYSTGCHLHLMVWVDGGRTNPMTWY